MILFPVLWIEYALFSLCCGRPAIEQYNVMSYTSKLAKHVPKSYEKHLSVFLVHFQAISIIIVICNSRTVQFCQLSKYSLLHFKVSSAILKGGKTTLNSLNRQNFVKLIVTNF